MGTASLSGSTPTTYNVPRRAALCTSLPYLTLHVWIGRQQVDTDLTHEPSYAAFMGILQMVL